MTTEVARLTRIRIEGSATTENELRDYLTSCVEDLCGLYGRVWEQKEPIDVQTTRKGFWGRITLHRKDVDARHEVVRVARRVT